MKIICCLFFTLFAVPFADAQDGSCFVQNPVTNSGYNGSNLRSSTINNDAFSDVVLLDPVNNLVSVYLNSGGSGTFSAPVSYTLPSTPKSLTIADFDNLNGNDLAIVCTNSIVVLKNNGSGNFTSSVVTGYLTGGATVYAKNADMDNDGYSDLVIGLGTSLEILKNNGMGSFTVSSSKLFSYNVSVFDVGDCNADGNKDVVALFSFQNFMTQLNGTGTGSLSAFQYTTTIGNSPQDIICMDISNDGRADALILDYGSSGVGTLRGLYANAGGVINTTTFTYTFVSGEPAKKMTKADFNNDGKPDLAVAIDASVKKLAVLINDNAGFFYPAKYYLANNTTIGNIEAGNFNTDSNIDVATLYLTGIPYQFSVWLNSLSPNVMASSSQSIVCNGSQVTLTATGANTYTWSNGITNNVAFTPSTSATYSVTGTNTITGCSNSNTISINVVAPPVISAVNGTICSGNTFTINPSGATSYTYSGSSSVVSPTSTTVYVVTGSDGNCTAIKNVTVTVNPLPTTFINGSTAVACAGSNVELNTISGNPSFYSTINGVQTILNNNLSYTVNAVQSQTYSIVVTNTVTGCNKALPVFTLTVPSATLIANTTNTNLCAGQSAILTVTTSPGSVIIDQITWYPGPFGQLSNTVSVSPSVSTVYTVTAQDQGGYGCNFTTVITQSVNTCTGFGNGSIVNNLEIYPNPASNFITVDLHGVFGTADNVKISIANALGEVIVTASEVSGSCIFNTGDLINGIYFIRIERKDGYLMKKFIKQ